MSHAFANILERRARRKQRSAWLAYIARRGSVRLTVVLVTTLIAVLLISFAEGTAYRRSGIGFVWPWEWIGTLLRGEQIARLTGATLVLYCGGWFSTLAIISLRRLLGLNLLAQTGAGGVLAIARGVIDEAVRNKVVVVLLSLLLLALAFQPYLSLGSIDKPLRYLIQAFISFSTFAASVLLGGVTILFAAYSVSGDLTLRRTGDVFVKPLGRGAYLLGKWLGAVSLIAVLVACWGLLTWGICQFWLGKEVAIDMLDRDFVTFRVLVSREELRPEPEVSFDVTAGEQLRKILETNPERAQQRGTTSLFEDLRFQQRVDFLSIPFGSAKTYRFEGLSDVRRRAERLDQEIQSRADEFVKRLDEDLNLTLRPEDVNLISILPYADDLGIDLSDALLQFTFKVQGYSLYNAEENVLQFRANGRPEMVRVIPDMVQTLDLPALILTEDDPETPEDESGVLDLEIQNGPIDPALLAQLPPSVKATAKTLQFDPDAWLNLYYRAGGFGGNVARATLVLWVRLAFLAMLAVVTAALFSYPVAATLSISIWILAAGGSYIQEVLSYQLEGASIAAVDATVDKGLVPIVQLFALVFSRFSSLESSDLLVNGRHISWSAVGWYVFWIGVVWTGAVLAIGWGFFARKEIARVQV